MPAMIYSDCDVVIIDDDVWISVEEPDDDGVNYYEREDLIRAEGYDFSRASWDDTPGGRTFRNRKPNFGSTGWGPNLNEDRDGARDVDPLEAWCDAWTRHTGIPGHNHGHGPFNGNVM